MKRGVTACVMTGVSFEDRKRGLFLLARKEKVELGRCLRRENERWKMEREEESSERP